jgi:hypothetical protein
VSERQSRSERDHRVAQSSEPIDPVGEKPINQATKATFNLLLEAAGPAKVSLAKRAKFADNFAEGDAPEIVCRERWSQPRTNREKASPRIRVAGSGRPEGTGTESRAWTFRGGEVLAAWLGGPSFAESCTVGVGHSIDACAARVGFPFSVLCCELPFSPSEAWGDLQRFMVLATAADCPARLCP